MKIQEIYNLAIKMGTISDFRGQDGVKKVLLKRKEKYEKLSLDKKQDFDIESLTSPFSDSRILNIAQDKEIKKALVGIDIEPAEILIAKELGDIDLIISHHPLGKGLATLSEVMELQCDILHQYGVPINIAEGLMKEKISEVARGLNKVNYERTPDAAKLLGINLMCIHTPCDNLAAWFLKKEVEKKSPETVGDIIKILENIPEYQKAKEFGLGPKVFVGKKENKCGKVAITEVTGGTEGSPKLYEKLAQAGVGTIIGMHISEEHKKQAESALINVVIAGHMSSDSLGVNLFLDELKKRGTEIVPCSGLTRINRI